MSVELSPEDPPEPTLAHARRRRSHYRAGLVFAAAMLPIAAVALGGATQPWTQAVVLLWLGVLLLLAPPKTSLGPALNAVFLALAALPALAFLPASWFKPLEWRGFLTDELGIVLSPRLTPQPWLTVDAWLLLLAGLTWLYWLLAIRWTSIERARLARWLAGGVVFLAGLCLAFRAVGYAPELWEAERGFGPFPNRNQTGNFFALGSLVILARAHLDLRRRASPWAGIAWVTGWLVVMAAVFMTNSRAAVLLLFGGAALYLAGTAWLGAHQAKHLESADEDDEEEPEPQEFEAAAAQRRERIVRTLALGASLLLFAAGAFFLLGGETLQRFRSTADARTGTDPNDLHFRLLIQQDALDLGAASAWPGTGLGNMSSLLTLYRDRSAIPARGIHPESDWVWLRVELGWIAVAVVLLGVFFLLRRVFPLHRGRVEPIRLAGLVALAGFFAHGFFDVSAHRVGSAFAALTVIALAVPRPERTHGFRRRPAQFAGLIFAAVGCVWLAAVWQRADYPGTIGALNHQVLAYEAIERGKVREAIAHVTRSLRWAPLNYHAYLLRAEIGVAARASVTDVEDDFARARGLEQQSPIPPYREARAWLKYRPERAIRALSEACARSPREAEKLIDSLLGAADNLDDGAFRKALRAWLREDMSRLLVFLRWAKPDEARAEIERVLLDDPGLAAYSGGQLAQFLAAWAKHGDAPALLVAFNDHAEWQTLAWESWAVAAARTGEIKRACEIAQRFSPAPTLPSVPNDDPIQILEREVVRQPDELVRVYQLFQALLKADRSADAVNVIARVTAQPRVPAYLHYVEAGARTQRGDFERAWECWQRYFAATRAS